MKQKPFLDELARVNMERWDALANSDVEYARPMLNLDATYARSFLDPEGVMQDVRGSDVLCLASGGGQQSVAFSLLGAKVTVFDLSAAQLQRDRLAAAHYDLPITIVQGDMRDLTAFTDDAFDLVHHAYSINFVPDLNPVHNEVARVLRPEGLYRTQWSNPFTQTINEESWNGEGYMFSQAYTDGRDMTELFPHWDVTDRDGNIAKKDSPHEFVHTLSSMINSLASHGFVILRASEDTGSEREPEPGSWPHFMSVAAPYLTLWAKYSPAAFRTTGLHEK